MSGDPWRYRLVVDHDGPHTQNKLLLILLLLVFGCFLRTENHRYLVANGVEIIMILTYIISILVKTTQNS